MDVYDCPRYDNSAKIIEMYKEDNENYLRKLFQFCHEVDAIH